MDTENIIIKRSHSCYRPMYANGVQIERIVVYSDDKTLTFQSGWLEHCNSVNEFYRYNDVIEISVSNLRKANKLNLAKKDNFILKYNDNNKSYFESGYCLYLYVKNIELVHTLTQIESEGLTKHSANFYKIPLDCKALNPELDDNGKLVYRDAQLTEIIVCSEHTFEKTVKSLMLEPLLNGLNEILGERSALSMYQLERIVKKYSIQPIE